MQLNNSYAAHIIRDIFAPTDRVVCYSATYDLVKELRKPEHGIEAWHLYTGDETESDISRRWNIETDDTFFGLNFCKLFISIDYDPLVTRQYDVAVSVDRFMASKGYVFLVNPGEWASKLIELYPPRYDLVHDIKSYSMFKDESVVVLQNA